MPSRACSSEVLTTSCVCLASVFLALKKPRARCCEETVETVCGKTEFHMSQPVSGILYLRISWPPTPHQSHPNERVGRFTSTSFRLAPRPCLAPHHMRLAASDLNSMVIRANREGRRGTDARELPTPNGGRRLAPPSRPAPSRPQAFCMRPCVARVRAIDHHVLC